MMTLKDTRQKYYDSTDKSSEIGRQLAFAALAVVWVFRTDQPGGGISVPYVLRWAAMCAVFALAFETCETGNR